MNPVTIGEWTFDYVQYDADRDVLYLSMGQPRTGYGEETPEGHVLRFDDGGEFYGVTLIGIRDLLSNGKPGLVVSVPPKPKPEELPRQDLEVLTAC